MRIWFLFALAAIVLPAGLVTADDPKGQKLTAREFAEKAASGGMFEVKSSQLALQRATGENIRKFAQRMVEDHTQANSQLAGLLTRKGLTVPAAMIQKHTDEFNRLSKLQGSAFERAYVESQLKAHKEAVELFGNAASHLDDTDVKTWAAGALPRLNEHLRMIQQIAGPAGPGPGERPGR